MGVATFKRMLSRKGKVETEGEAPASPSQPEANNGFTCKECGFNAKIKIAYINHLKKHARG